MAGTPLSDKPMTSHPSPGRTMLSPWLIQLINRSGSPSENRDQRFSFLTMGKKLTAIGPYSCVLERSTMPPDCRVSH